MSKSCLKDTEGLKTVIERHPDVASPCEASLTVAALNVTVRTESLRRIGSYLSRILLGLECAGTHRSRHHTAKPATRGCSDHSGKSNHAFLLGSNRSCTHAQLSDIYALHGDVAPEKNVGNSGIWATRAVEHDLESFYWVILYVVYRHTVEDEALRATDLATHETIKEEFGRLFSALNPGELAQERRLLLLVDDVLDPGGMQSLLEYMERHCPPLSGLLLALWRDLRECARPAAGSKKKIPEERLQREKAQLAFLEEHGLPVEYTQRSKKPAIPTMVHRRLCLHIQLMLKELNQVS